MEYAIPVVDMMPSLESVLNELDGDLDFISTTGSISAPTPTPSLDDQKKSGTILRHVILQGITPQIASAAVSLIKFDITKRFSSDTLPFMPLGTSFIWFGHIGCCVCHGCHWNVSRLHFGV